MTDEEDRELGLEPLSELLKRHAPRRDEDETEEEETPNE
jgi:hypothetical protein